MRRRERGKEIPWGRFLASRFSQPEYNNDFASWAYRALHEKALAEKLSMINPISCTTIENLRGHLRQYLALMIGIHHGIKRSNQRGTYARD